MRLLLLLFIVGCVVALPARKSYYKRYAQSARLQAAYARPRRAPLHRTMFISGYYRPLFAQRRQQTFEPETAMSAFATGDSVAAGSYLGSRVPNCITCDQDNPEQAGIPELDQSEGETPAADFPDNPELPVVPLNDEVADVIPAKPARPPKRKQNKKVKQPEIDDDEGEEDTIVTPGRNNQYFPVIFKGYGGSRSASGGGGGGGGVTAIANSYSTGKGGVATSHATAYGGPAPSRPRKRPMTTVEDEDDE